MKTTPHKHAHILRAIADGKEVQCRVTDACAWVPGSLYNLSNLDDVQWRVKPETIIINNIEVPKPSLQRSVEAPYRVLINVGTGCWVVGDDMIELFFDSSKSACSVFNALVKPFKE